MEYELEQIWCMVPTEHSQCKRPVQYVWHGSEGPFYRCGKHGKELLRRRDDMKTSGVDVHLKSDGTMETRIVVSTETWDWLQERLNEPAKAIPELVELFKKHPEVIKWVE